MTKEMNESCKQHPLPAEPKKEDNSPFKHVRSSRAETSNNPVRIFTQCFMNPIGGFVSLRDAYSLYIYLVHKDHIPYYSEDVFKHQFLRFMAEEFGDIMDDMTYEKTGEKVPGFFGFQLKEVEEVYPGGINEIGI